MQTNRRTEKGEKRKGSKKKGRAEGWVSFKVVTMTCDESKINGAR